MAYLHQGDAPPESRLSKIGLQMRPRTVIQFHVYDISEGQRAIQHGADVLESLGMPLSELSNSGISALEKHLRKSLDMEFYNDGDYEITNGVHLAFLSDDGKEVKRAVQSLLISISTESPTKSPEIAGQTPEN